MPLPQPFRHAAAVLAIALALPAGSAGAQETTQPDSRGGSAASDLSLGSTGEPQVGDTYVSESNGDWEMRCLRREDPATDPCQMYQLLENAEGVPVAEVSIFRLPEGGQAVAGGTIVVPLETALQRQLNIQIDDGAPKRYPFAFCNSVGCYVRMGLTAEDVAAFKKGNMARISIVPALAPDQVVELGLSLKGFTASYDKASVMNP